MDRIHWREIRLCFYWTELFTHFCRRLTMSLNSATYVNIYSAGCTHSYSSSPSQSSLMSHSQCVWVYVRAPPHTQVKSRLSKKVASRCQTVVSTREQQASTGLRECKYREAKCQTTQSEVGFYLYFCWWVFILRSILLNTWIQWRLSVWSSQHNGGFTLCVSTFGPRKCAQFDQ